MEGVDWMKAPHKVKIMMRHRGTLQHRYRMNGMRFLLALRRGVETGHQGTTKEREEKTMIYETHREVSYTGQPSRIVGMCGPDQGTNEPLLQSH